MEHETLAALKSIMFFQGMDEEQLKSVADIVQPKTFAKGEIIFSEGENATGFYAVVRGKVKIFKSSVAGREQTLHIFGPGAPFGEVPVFTGGLYPAYAGTLEKTECLFFPKQEFLALVRAKPDLVLNILAVLSRRLHHFTDQVETLSLKEVPERLASYILSVAERKNQDTIALDIPKGELATLLGTIPETLSRILSKLIQKNILAVRGSEIEIKDRDSLVSVAQGMTRI